VVVKLSWSIASLTRGFLRLSSDAPCSNQAVTNGSCQDEKGSVTSGSKSPTELILTQTGSARYRRGLRFRGHNGAGERILRA